MPRTQKSAAVCFKGQNDTIPPFKALSCHFHKIINCKNDRFPLKTIYSCHFLWVSPFCVSLILSLISQYYMIDLRPIGSSPVLMTQPLRKSGHCVIFVCALKRKMTHLLSISAKCVISGIYAAFFFCGTGASAHHLMWKNSSRNAATAS